MASKIVMQFGDIKGDFQDTKHTNWIQLHTLNFNVSRNVTQESGNLKRNLGNPNVSKIVVTKIRDCSTPAIFLESLTGKGQNCVIRSLVGGQTINVGFEYKLENAIIAKYSVHEITSSSDAMEEIEISFTSIKTIYTPYDSSGKIGTPMASGYNISEAKYI